MVGSRGVKTVDCLEDERAEDGVAITALYSFLLDSGSGHLARLQDHKEGITPASCSKHSLMVRKADA